MPDIVVSVFKFENNKGYFVPRIEFGYLEKDTGVQWTINCGGTRGYFIRFGHNLNKSFDEQAADSHFMANRVTTALFLSGSGLFQAKSMGRVIIEDICLPELKVTTHIDLWDRQDKAGKDKEMNIEFVDWYKFICANTLFRRAADDAYAALLNPVETDFFIYRGMEWLLKAAHIRWEELASDIGITPKEIKNFKKQVNHDLGQRHGIESGIKRRAEMKIYGPLIADFIYGLGNVRKRIDKNFPGFTTVKAAEIVKKAMSFVSYP